MDPRSNLNRKSSSTARFRRHENLDPGARLDFSVLEMTRRRLEAEGLLEAGLDPVERVATSGAATTRITGTPAALLRWCRATERVVIQRSLGDARVFAGFECFSRARFVAKRYSQIADRAAALHVFGRADAALDFSVTTKTEVVSGPLLREWFLLVDSAAFCGLLTARDLDGLDGSVSPRKRRFDGLVTHHLPTLRALADELESRLGAASAR